jgi:predicted kinase
MLGIPVSQRRFDGYGKGIYKGNIGKKVYDELMRRAKLFLSGGYSVIMDATFLREDSRNRARDAAAKVGAPALFVFADCPERIVKSRLRRRAIENSFSDANLDVYRAMKSRFKPPRASREIVRIDTSQPLKQSLAKIERALLRI